MLEISWLKIFPTFNQLFIVVYNRFSTLTKIFIILIRFSFSTIINIQISYKFSVAERFIFISLDIFNQLSPSIFKANASGTQNIKLGI